MADLQDFLSPRPVDNRRCPKCWVSLHVSTEQRRKHQCAHVAAPEPPPEALPSEEATLKRVRESSTPDERQKRHAARQNRSANPMPPPPPPLPTPLREVPVYDNESGDYLAVVTTYATGRSVVDSFISHQEQQMFQPFFPFKGAGDALLLLLHAHLIRDGGRLSNRSTTMFGHLINFLKKHHPAEEAEFGRALRSATSAYLSDWPAHQVIDVERLNKDKDKGRNSRVILLDFAAVTEEIAWTHGHLLRNSFFEAKFDNKDRIYHSPQQARLWEILQASKPGRTCNNHLTLYLRNFLQVPT